jgi:hypothetical protein
VPTQRYLSGGQPIGCHAPSSVYPRGGFMGTTATLRNGVNLDIKLSIG